MLRCTAPRCPAHIEILYQLEIGGKWSTSLRLLLLMCFGVCQAIGAIYKAIYCACVVSREIQRETEEWNIDLKLTKVKKLVLCAALREKRKGNFSLLKTHKEDKLGFSLGRLFGCYNHRKLKYSEWKILLPGFVMR